MIKKMISFLRCITYVFLFLSNLYIHVYKIREPVDSIEPQPFLLHADYAYGAYNKILLYNFNLFALANLCNSLNVFDGTFTDW